MAAPLLGTFRRPWSIIHCTQRQKVR